jgi:hypothetical protein
MTQPRSVGSLFLFAPKRFWSATLVLASCAQICTALSVKNWHESRVNLDTRVRRVAV